VQRGGGGGPNFIAGGHVDRHIPGGAGVSSVGRGAKFIALTREGVENVRTVIRIGDRRQVEKRNRHRGLVEDAPWVSIPGVGTTVQDAGREG